MKISFGKYFCLGLLISVTAPLVVSADTSVKFNIDPVFNASDNSQQYQILATLKKSFNQLNFYVEDSFLNSKTWTESNEMNNVFSNLDSEFENKIYHQLTNAFGSDRYSEKNTKINVIFYPMKDTARGYIRSIDAYDKSVNPMSNQGETIYLNANYISSPYLSAILAHEFTHIIEFNQKTLKRSVSEDTWLSEARAEYAVTMLGYNNSASDDTYLDQRIKNFLNKPNDSLTEWNDASSDYGVINMFIHYLVEQYGVNILTDSVKSNKTGINSINEALINNKYKDTFADVYSNWSVAVYLNDCSLSSKYCYKNEKLKDARVLPVSTFMPFFQESSISMNQLINNWSTNWQKFVGGVGDFKLDIKSPKSANFKVAYIVKDLSDNYHVYFLTFKDGEEKQITIPDLKDNVSSIVFISSVEGSALEGTVSNLFFVYNTVASTTLQGSGSSSSNMDINLPFDVSKPLNEMNREELLNVLLRLVIYLISQGRTVF